MLPATLSSSYSETPNSGEVFNKLEKGFTYNLDQIQKQRFEKGKSSSESNEANANKTKNLKSIKSEESELEEIKDNNEINSSNSSRSGSNKQKHSISSDTKMTTGALSSTPNFIRPIEVNSLNSENQENVSSNITTPVSSDNGFNRINDIRFTTLGDDHIVNRNGLQYSNDTIHRNDYETGNHRNYEPVATTTAFERYDPNYSLGRSSIYSYNQPITDDVQSLQKFSLDGQQTIASSQQHLKTENEENSGPLYPRPLYHFDPSNPNATNGFSAINLSVKIASAQAPYRSPSSPSPSVPVIDLSTSNITSSTSFHRSSRSPVSSTQSAQIPSSTAQTLDLSLSRISHR